MSFKKQKIYWIIISLIAVIALAGCGSTGAGSSADPVEEPDTTPPRVTSTSPADLATGSAINSIVTAKFSKAMDPATIVAANFTLAAGETAVAGSVTYDLGTMTAIFAPDANVIPGTTYTATVTTVVTDSAGNAMEADKGWTFETAAEGAGPEPVNLGTAGNYVILAKSAVSTEPTSAITGNIGLSPAATTYITGFSLTDATGFATSAQVTGALYAADMAPPTPINLTTAVSNMHAAYTDAAGRTEAPIIVLAATMVETPYVPGLYKANGNVAISSDVTISGNANDVWIFQIPGNLVVNGGFKVILAGGALARNIFWQVAGDVEVKAGAHFEGIILSQTKIVFGTGASMNGRALAQTAVNLDKSTIVAPAD